MAEYAVPVTATVSMKVDLNTNGQIAQNGDTKSGAKAMQIKGIKANSTLAQSNAVYQAFYSDIGGGTFDSLSAYDTTKRLAGE